MARERDWHQVERVKEDILTGCRILDHEGLVKAFGHISARVPGADGLILITPRRALRLVRGPSDIALVDLAGRVVEGETAPCLEHPMHLAIYKRRPEIGAICRAHGPYTYAFGIVEQPVKAVHGWSALVGENVPVYSNPHLITTPELGDEVVNALDGAQALILRGNGTITLGRSVPEAVVKTLFLEEGAQLLYHALQIGKPVYVTGQDQKRRAVADDQEYIRAWNYYKTKLEA